MGNRSRREMEGQAILRDMLAHPPREKPIPKCDLCGEPAVIGAYTGHRAHDFLRIAQQKASGSLTKLTRTSVNGLSRPESAIIWTKPAKGRPR